MSARAWMCTVAGALVLTACASTAAPSETPAKRGETAVTVEESTIGGTMAEIGHPPELPPPPADRSTTAFIDDGYRYAMRLEMAQLRDTPLEPEARRMMEAIPYWRDIMDSSGLDPIGQIDRLIVAAPERRSADFLVLARHDATAEQVRATARALADEQVTAPDWREVDGLQVARWPMRDDRPRSIVVLDEHWVAIAPNHEVRRVIAVASRGDDAELVPGDPMPWSPQQPLLAEGVGLHAVGREGVREERPEHYPVRFELDASIREDGGVVCEWHGTYRDAEEAEAAHAHWESRRKSYAENTMVKMLGLARPIEDAQWSRDGEELTFELDLTLDEMALLIRFATPIVVGDG